MSLGLCWLSYAAMLPRGQSGICSRSVPVGYPRRKSDLQSDAFNHLAIWPFGSPDEVCRRSLPEGYSQSSPWGGDGLNQFAYGTIWTRLTGLDPATFAVTERRSPNWATASLIEQLIPPFLVLFLRNMRGFTLNFLKWQDVSGIWEQAVANYKVKLAFSITPKLSSTVATTQVNDW